MSNKVISSILKSPDSERKGLKVRFDLSQDISEILEAYIKGNDRSGYIGVLNYLTSETLDYNVLRKWLNGLRENISLITPQCEGLISLLLKVNWTNHDEEFIQTFESFILNLLSAHTHYLKMVIKSLIDRLKPCTVGGCSEVEIPLHMIGQINAEDRKIFHYVHRIIKAIVILVPASHEMLTPLLANGFPYMIKNEHHQACYFLNLLFITQYIPDFRKAILEILIDKMIRIDVHSPKQDILDAESEKDDNEESFKQGCTEDTIFEMDVSTDNVNGVKTLNENGDVDMTKVNEEEKDETDLAMSHELGNLLDVMMNAMLSYIHDLCYANVGELDWDSTKKLYKELLFIFNKLILPTHASCHVQFIMFYICSFRSALCEGFLDYLWKRVTDPNTPPILRQSAVSYFGSYLARATYISVNTVATCLQIMLGWLHRYIDSQDGSERSFPDISLHGPFYSVCQASFYVFAFRHKELLEMPQGYTVVKSLNFERIVASSLNPLRFCLPVVVRNFASIARNYQLAYCFTIIEKNNRAALQMVTRNPAHAILHTKNALDSFFPFDPYVLVRSSTLISPIYREYQGPLEDEQTENVESYEIISKDGSSFSPSKMTSSPSTLPEFLLHGSSPGFKHSLLIKSMIDWT